MNCLINCLCCETPNIAEYNGFSKNCQKTTLFQLHQKTWFWISKIVVLRGILNLLKVWGKHFSY